jgi:hypothetical protein
MNGIMALILYTALRRENKRRDAKYGAAPASTGYENIESEEYMKRWGLEGMTRDEIIELGDEHPAYRYML